jgi:hypothetical protein
MVAVCKLCEEERALVRAHIIPDAFNRDLKGDAATAPVMLSSKDFPKRRPGGHYDDALVCEHCERRFSAWDDYGADLFLHRLRADENPWCDESGAVHCFRFDNVQYELLKLFAISLLWRSSETSLPFFSRIALGPHAKKAREMILSGDPGTPEEFSVFAARWTAQPEHKLIAETQLGPYTARLQGINEVKIFLAGSILHVKVDKRPHVSPFAELILRPGLPMFVIARELEGSKDIQVVRPILEAEAARRRARLQQQ